MKSLTQYIIENQQVHLSEVVINEGLLKWFKKMWNWIFNDAKDNVSKNNGVYKSSPELLSAISDNKKIDGKFTFVQLDNEAFNQFLKDAKSENKDGTFVRAKELKSSESTIYSCVLQYKKESGTIAILICEADKKSKQLKINHIVLANDIVKNTKDIKKHPLCSQIVSEFDKYIKSEIKFIIKGEVKSEVVDDKVIKQPNDDKSEENTANNKNENTNYIKESIDDENLYWKMNIFFQKDNFQKTLWNGLFIDGDVDKAISDGFDVKGFVNFITDDTKPALDKDYKYQMTRIINLLRAKNYKIR